MMVDRREALGGLAALAAGPVIPSIHQFVAGLNRLLAALPGDAGARMAALDRAGRTATPEYLALAQQFYDRHFCRRQPMPPELAATMAIVGRSIAYRVMNGPNEFTVVGTFKDWDRTRDLHRITVPTLITHGQFDEVTPDCIATVHHGIAGSRVETFADCSHQSMNERPLDYVQRLRRFLDHD